MNRRKKNTGKTLWLKIRRPLIVAAAGFFIYSILTGNYGLIKLYELSKEKKELTREIKVLKTEIDSLKKVSKKLDGDAEYIEKVAREKYNMVKKGETVYQMVPADR